MDRWLRGLGLVELVKVTKEGAIDHQDYKGKGGLEAGGHAVVGKGC